MVTSHFICFPETINNLFCVQIDGKVHIIIRYIKPFILVTSKTETQWLIRIIQDGKEVVELKYWTEKLWLEILEHLKKITN